MTNPDTMTNEELRVAVAEARGWTQIRTVNRVMMGVRPNETRTFQTVAILSPSKTLTAISLVPNFPTDANAALTLCDALAKDGWHFAVDGVVGNPFEVVFAKSDTDRVIAHGPTLPIALCRAYLKTRESR